MNIISAKDAPAVHKSARGEPSQAHKVKSTVYVRTCVALLYGWAVGTEVCTTASVWGTCVHMLLGLRERKCTQAKCRKWHRCAVCRKLLMVCYIHMHAHMYVCRCILLKANLSVDLPFHQSPMVTI